MQNLHKSQCAAALITSALLLAGTVPTQAVAAVTAEHVRPSLPSVALATVQASLTDQLASVAAPAGEDPPVLVPTPDPQALPDPNTVYIESITTLGKGCPTPQSVASVIAPDQKSFVLIFTEMELQYLPEPNKPLPPKKQTTNCQAVVQLHVPNGLQVSIASVVTRGFADLDVNFKGSQFTSFFFAGQPLTAVAKQDVIGPFEGIYTSPAPVLFGTFATSHCGESALLGMNTTLSLTAPAGGLGDAIFNTTTTDGAFQMLFHINITPCP